MLTIEIGEMTPERISDEGSTKLYAIPLSNGKQAFVFCRDVHTILRHLGLREPFQLIGRSFEAPDDYENCGGSELFDLFLRQVQSDGKYCQPDFEALWNRAAHTLAQLQCPDFSDVDDYWVYSAFSCAKREGSFEDWWKSIIEQVKRLSCGLVSIERASEEDFSITSKVKAHYFELVRGNEIIRFLFRSHSVPFVFDR